MTVRFAAGDLAEKVVALDDIDGYNHAVGPCRFFLRLLGAWPDPRNDVDRWTTSARCLVVTSIMFCFTLSQTVKMALLYKDLNLVTEILTNCHIPTTIATIKIASIWYYRWELRDLLQQIMEDWDTFRNKYESALMWKNARISRIFSIGCIFMTESTLVAQCVVGLFRPIYYALKSNLNESLEWPLYMKGSFPYDVQATPNYELSVFGQLLSNVFASTSFSSADSFFIVLMFHLIGQLSILKMAIFNLPGKIQNSDDRNKFMDRFAIVHRRHNQLWRFSMAIEESFNTMFLIQMIPCIFALCTQGYQLVMIADAENTAFMELIFMIYFLVLFLFTIFTYCYAAELLRRKSLELSYAVYDCDWTILPAKETRLLLLILVRTQHPFEITAGKFASFSLPLYCRILKTSAGYLSMLLAVKKRSEQSVGKIVL